MTKSKKPAAARPAGPARAVPTKSPGPVASGRPAAAVKADAPKKDASRKDGKPAVARAAAGSSPAAPAHAVKTAAGGPKRTRAERSAERAAKRVAEAARAKAAAASAAFDAAEAREPRKYPKGGPTKADLKRYRDKLLEMRRTLLSSSKELAAEALKASGQDFSVDHMADHGSDNYEQDFSLKLLEGESAQLTDIRDALMKIDGKLDPPFCVCESCADGEQKLCETCPWIPPSRHDVLPHARLCVQTKEIEERRRT